MLHFVDRLFSNERAQLAVVPVLAHFSVQKILIDRGQFFLQRLVQRRNNFRVARDSPYFIPTAGIVGLFHSKPWMKRNNPIHRAIFALVFAATAAQAGPPFQTDDPEPIEFRHYEFYTFASSDGTQAETDTAGPAVEFNWGALPNVHLHVIVPAMAIFPRTDPRAFGLGDIELGIKYRFVQETKHRPMVGTFVMFEVPTGNAARGLGLGKTWYKVPIWAQKSFGPWTTYGGGGMTVVNTPGYRNFPFLGWLVQRDLGKKWTLGTEVFYHG